jgi:hypothetical protein
VPDFWASGLVLTCTHASPPISLLPVIAGFALSLLPVRPIQSCPAFTSACHRLSLITCPCPFLFPFLFCLRLSLLMFIHDCAHSLCSLRSVPVPSFFSSFVSPVHPVCHISLLTLLYQICTYKGRHMYLRTFSLCSQCHWCLFHLLFSSVCECSLLFTPSPCCAAALIAHRCLALAPHPPFTSSSPLAHCSRSLLQARTMST